MMFGEGCIAAFHCNGADDADQHQHTQENCSRAFQSVEYVGHE